jgi:hypothetical protein
VITIVIDTPQGIARSFQIVDEFITKRGLLVTSGMVPAMSSAIAKANATAGCAWRDTTTSSDRFGF